MMDLSKITLTKRHVRNAGLMLAGGAALAYFHARSPAEAGAYLPCLVKRWTGHYCAGCGGQRALHALLHGRVAEAAGHNLLLVILLLLGGVCLIAAWGWPAELRAFWRRRGGVALAVLFLIAACFTVLRNLPWQGLHLLAP